MDDERMYSGWETGLLLLNCPDCGVFMGQYHDQLCKFGKDEEKDEIFSDQET